MRYYTDVLVIGAGSAGLHAAIEASEHGAKVMLVHKGRGNATIMAAGGFAGNFVAHDQKELESINKVFMEDILTSGRYMSDEDIVRTLVDQSGLELSELQEQGVNFIEDKNQDFKLFHAGGHTYPRTIRCRGGNTRQYYSYLRHRALENGIDIISNAKIVDLIMVNGKVQGAIGLYKDQIIEILSTSTVLATGGIAANYNFSTHQKTIQGQGLAMALKVGAKLVDMEFIQFMPTVMVYPKKLSGLLITDTLRGEGAVLLNERMERFMERYSPIKKDKETRDKVSKCIVQEIMEGRGTNRKSVYLDARHIARDRIEQSFTNYHLLMKAGIDPTKELMEIAPAAHYLCGGIKVDSDAHTGVEGLWATGEVAAGLHGANRLGSVALTENIVFGKIAGRNAAIYSMENKKKVKESDKGFGYSVRWDDFFKYEKLINDLREVLSQGAGVIRDEKEIKNALKVVENIQEEVDTMISKKPAYLYDPLVMEVGYMALINYCILKSCQMRKESRGTHFRKDYLDEDGEYLKHIVIEKKDNKINHYFKIK